MYCPDCYEEWHASAPEKQGVLDLRENTYLAKAIGYITNAFSKNKSRKYRIFQIKCLKTNPELRFIVQLANKAFKLTISQKMQNIAYVSNTILHWILGMILRPALDCLE